MNLIQGWLDRRGALTPVTNTPRKTWLWVLFTALVRYWPTSDFLLLTEAIVCLHSAEFSSDQILEMETAKFWF